MEITPTQLSAAVPPVSTQPNASQNREIARAARTLNEEGVAGAGREFSFSVDPKTKVAIVRIIDAGTGEVISQYPSDHILKVAQQLEELRSINSGRVR